VVLASVDPPPVQLAMDETWFLPFRWVSDPGGASLARPLDAWNPQREVFKPLVLAVAPDGRELFRELSRDFTDRPDDEPVLSVLEALALDPVDIPPWRPDDVDPEPSAKAFKPASFIPYFRAIKMNTGALAERMHDERDRDQLLVEHRMADSFLAAFDEWRAEHPPSEQR
jgi:hypothetical protein